jgi:uncharacterized protein (TIGR03083 family)
VSSADRPVTILPKADVLTALFTSWADIERLMADVSEQQWRTPSPLPGWSVHDVVAHIVGTEMMLLGEQTPALDVEGVEHVRNDIGAINEAWVRHLEPLSGVELLERFRAVTAERRAVLTAMGDDEWYAVGFTPAGPDSYGRFMRIRVFDCWLHEQDIRQALDRPATDGELAGPAGRTALDEMTASMGFVVGRLGKAPDGSRVALELTGPLARTIRVAVTGRAEVVDDFGGAAPTTTLRLDALDFARLCGGRIASAHLDIDGDLQVGQQILAKLNYLI